MITLFNKPQTRRHTATKVIAVNIYADWCSESHLLSETYEDLKNRFDGQEVLFVTLDATNSSTKHQSELLAKALGIENAIAPHQETGQMILMTYRGKQVFGMLNSTQGFDEMVKIIDKKLG